MRWIKQLKGKVIQPGTQRSLQRPQKQGLNVSKPLDQRVSWGLNLPSDCSVWEGLSWGRHRVGYYVKEMVEGSRADKTARSFWTESGCGKKLVQCSQQAGQLSCATWTQHDHFPVSTVYISISRVTTAPMGLGTSVRFMPVPWEEWHQSSRWTHS